MLSFFANRGIEPERILSLSAIERQFYYASKDNWYRELNLILELIIKALQGGVRVG